MKIYYKGKLYRSLTDCYVDNQEQTSVGLATVRRRLKNGWALEMALESPKEPTCVSKRGCHVVHGVEFQNLPMVAKHFGMTRDAVFKRHSRGFRGDDLVPRHKLLILNGSTNSGAGKFIVGDIAYRSAADACRRLGVKYVTYQNRINRGLSRKQALGLVAAPDGRKMRNCQAKRNLIAVAANRFSAPNGECKRIALSVHGVTYPTYAALARAFGLKTHVVWQRIVRSGWTIEQAIGTSTHRRPITVNGVEYESRAAAAAAHGLSLEVFLGRLRLMSPEEALGLTVRENSRTVEYRGQRYCSQRAAAEAHGISLGALNGRLAKGLTFHEAMDLGPKVSNSGRYNLAILNRDPELASTPAKTYLAEVQIEGRLLHKIGVTTVRVESRLRQETPHFRILAACQDTLMNCYQLEQALHRRFAGHRCESITAASLEGYTELFSLTDSDVAVVCQAMSDLVSHRL